MLLYIEYMSPRLLSIVLIWIMACGALALRLPRLGLRPMHCDEAVQAAKAGTLLETGQYRYDPFEYHGPTLNWFTLPLLRLSSACSYAETSEASYRIVPVLFGVGLILLLTLVADGLGRGAAIGAALLTAISPAMVFYSRYYIHETLLVFFTFATMACAWRYVCSGRLRWAVAAGASLGLMHATKETWVFAAAAMAVGVLVAIAWTRWRGDDHRQKESFNAVHLPQQCDATPNARLTPTKRAMVRTLFVSLFVAALSACGVAVAFYSSFGSNWRGPIDSVLTYATYFDRGGGGTHQHAWYYYFQLLTAFHPARGFFWSEGLIVGLAVAGCVAALAGNGMTRPQRAFGRFLVFYTLMLTGLYAAVPYKTPWCMLSFLHGMILLAAVGAWAILQWLPGWTLKSLASMLLAAGVIHLGWQCYALNFRFYADERNPYVYAYTAADAVNLAGQLERLAQSSPEGHDMLIHVVTPENYWPLPWYLRRFNAEHIGYWNDAVAWRNDAAKCAPPAVIILTADVQPTIDENLPAAYNKQMIYGLRPGVLLIVYVREDLWHEAFDPK
jgi:uncharacterized protein (TIGR03663 family)